MSADTFPPAPAPFDGAGGVRTTAEAAGRRERVVTFGPQDALVGIATEPARDAGAAAPRFAVIMSNVGLNHRVGPSRAWVELARRLAAAGVPSLRFDLSGMGDSAPRHDEPDDIRRGILDLEDAVTWATTHLAPACVLVSNCSGTDHAHVLAARDARVTGAVFLDGYTYPTWRYALHQRVLRYVRRRNWLRFLRRNVPRRFGLPIDPVRRLPDEERIFVRSSPPRAAFAADVARMTARGARLLFVFSGETSYAYADQFWDWMGGRGRGADGITVAYFPEANHTYSYRDARDRMLARVIAWITALR